MNKIKKIKHIFISFSLFSLLLLQSLSVFSINNYNYKKNMKVEFEIPKPADFNYEEMYQYLWDKICICRGWEKVPKFKYKIVMKNISTDNPTTIKEDEVFIKIFEKGKKYSSEDMLSEIKKKHPYFYQIYIEEYNLSRNIDIRQYLYVKNNDKKFEKQFENYITIFYPNQKNNGIENNNKFTIHLMEKKIKLGENKNSNFINKKYESDFDFIKFTKDIYIVKETNFNLLDLEFIKEEDGDEWQNNDISDKPKPKFEYNVKNHNAKGIFNDYEIIFFDTIKITKGEKQLEYATIREEMLNSKKPENTLRELLIESFT